jgi:hypothetical protein
MRRPRKHLPDGSLNPLWRPVSQGKRAKPLSQVDPRAAALVAPPFPCPNCDAPVPDAQLFCLPLCRQEAKYVRYYRARIADRSARHADIHEALRIRLALILAGGYDERLRRIPDDIRRAVIECDNDRCRNCSGPGRDIDHIRGSSNDLSNLQLLCADCHRLKTMSNFETISPISHPEEWANAVALETRAKAIEPLRFCDHADWTQMWRTVAAARRRAVAALV